MWSIKAAELQDLQAIRLFYNQCGYGGGAEPEDQIFIAHQDKTVVGAVRLCPGEKFTVLRGMQALSTFQRQKIGTQLLHACAQALADQVCYCLPWKHLTSFYNQIGFHTLAPTQAPDLLRDRFQAYTDKGMDIVLMCRLPSPHGQ